MRVVQVVRFGGPEVLVPAEAADPVAAPGEVVVEVSAADVLFLDAQLRRGAWSDHLPVEPPYVPGNGVAGRVIFVGEGVDPGWVGRRVVAHTGQGGGRGGYAERAVVALDALVEVPDELDLCDAAALLHDGQTALGLVDAAAVLRDEWVLVVGAGGGLGVLLVQLAAAAGARVVAAARGRKLDLARQMGAGVVVDYSEPAWPERVLERSADAHAAIEARTVTGKTLLLTGGPTPSADGHDVHAA
jgi:NADPH2:quinone reductase